MFTYVSSAMYCVQFQLYAVQYIMLQYFFKFVREGMSVADVLKDGL